MWDSPSNRGIIDPSRPINWQNNFAKGLLGAWMPSLGNNGSVLLDAVRTCDGTLTGFNNATDWRVVQDRPCLTYNATSSYLTCVGERSKFAAPSGSCITISAMVKRNLTTSWRPIVTQGTSTGDGGNNNARNYEFVFAGGLNVGANSLSLIYRSSTNTTWHGYGSNKTYTDTSRFYHVGVTYKMSTASTAKLFEDGAEIAGNWDDGTGNDAPYTANNPRLYIGNTNQLNEYYSGDIAWIFIWNRLFGAGEMSKFHECAMRGFPGLLNRISFDDVGYAPQATGNRRRRVLLCS